MVNRIYLARGLIKHKGRFLLLKKSRDIMPENIGKWEAPGGRIREGEDPAETIIREVKEETCLDSEIVKELPLIERKTAEIESKCHVFLLKVDSSRIDPDNVELSDEHSDFLWATKEEIKKMANDTELVMFAELLLEYVESC